MSDIDAVPTHITSVSRVEPLAPAFVRVTFAGGLDRYVPKGPDDFVYVLLPPPGRDALTIDESFRWSAYYEMTDEEKPVGAYYTVRNWRSGVCEIDCDVFLHQPAGTVSAWAPNAAAGDPVALWGPRTAWAPPAAARSWVLLADETGIPAVRAILDQRPADVDALCLLEVDDPEDHEPLPAGAGVRARWLPRAGAAAGTTTLLLDAVCDLHQLDPSTYVWGGAESRAMAAIRRHVRHERGLAKAHVSLTPYWRHPAHADDPTDTDD